MNKFSTSYILFLFFISTSRIIAQHEDCNTSLELCGNSPFYIIPSSGTGITDLDIANSCLFQEFNPMWVKWAVMESGTVTFVLTPDSVDQDIDFIVFRSESDFDCNNKTQIRCMAAGANVGQPPHKWAHCAGATGLSATDIDIEEPAGCFPTSNNFLAPIEAVAGDQYIMLINDFAISGFGYTLSFGGTAVLDCITVSTYPEEVIPQSTFAVYPTVSTGAIYLRAGSAELTDAHLTIFNMEGQLVYSKEQLIGTPSRVDLHHLPQGAYFAILSTINSSQTNKFIITK